MIVKYCILYPLQCDELVAKIETSIADVASWMMINRLFLTGSETRLLWCFTWERIRHFLTRAINIAWVVVHPSSHIHNLGIIFDENLTFTKHVSALIKASFYQLRHILSITKYLSISLTKNIITSLILPCVDWCNSLLYGALKAELNWLQSVFNAIAKVIFCWSKFDHVTSLLWNALHCLCLMECIVFKWCLLEYKTVHNKWPSYIRDLITSER